MNGCLNLMDVTLRDGSYAINFQFSEYDTEILCAELHSAGMDYIEIGHGMGLRASSIYNGEALCSDEEYLMAAQRAGAGIKYGMFCIPGVAKAEDIDTLREYGASFVRIGTNVNEVEKSEKYIERAKSLGLEVMANYMKSYVATKDEFKRSVQMSKEFGVDTVYVVDSAGSMNSEDILRYYDAIMEVGDIKTGFHGHNNLGLAVANSMYAVELGFDFVDTALLGMGRSAGNAATELVVANLLKRGYKVPYDCKKLMGVAEKYIQPIYKHFCNALDVYCGMAEFHSSYMKYIHKYSSKYHVNPLDLIMEYTKYDKINMDERLLEKLAKELPRDDTCNLMEFGFNEYFGNEQKR